MNDIEKYEMKQIFLYAAAASTGWFTVKYIVIFIYEIVRGI